MSRKSTSSKYQHFTITSSRLEKRSHQLHLKMSANKVQDKIHALDELTKLTPRKPINKATCHHKEVQQNNGIQNPQELEDFLENWIH